MDLSLYRSLSLVWLILLFFESCVSQPTKNSYENKISKDLINFKSEILIDNPMARKFRTKLSDEIRLGPNFNKKFRFVQLGCGSGCSLLSIINCETGQVIDPKLVVTDISKTIELGERVSISEESPHLVLRGCLNEDSKRCGVHKLFFDGELIRSVK